MDIKVNDKFVMHSSNGMDYKMEVVNINTMRDPAEKYGVDMWDGNGIYAGDVMFFGDDFWENNSEIIEKIET